MNVFVTVGNATQSFHRLLSQLERARTLVPGKWFVQHGNTPFNVQSMNSKAFLSMEEFEILMASANLVITHAGAGAVINAVRLAKVPVVVPRQARYGEHIDDHQMEFASELVGLGKVVLCCEPLDLATAMIRALEMQEANSKPRSIPPLVSLVSNCIKSYAKRA